jgi:MobA/MobL family
MAIFSLCHSAVGRSTHRAGTAAAHAAYIARRSAASAVLGEHMPTGGRAARTWLRREEASDRKNARVIDKVMLALPVELTPAERENLVRVFVWRLGHGRVPWLAALHDLGKDAHNPHAHVILRDRDARTGKRVMKLSEKDSTNRLRVVWEACVNRALEATGRPERVSRLSLAAQGQERPPERHRGPRRSLGGDIGRTYGFSPKTQRAAAVTPAAFAEAGREQLAPKPQARPVPRMAAQEMCNWATPEPPEPRPPPRDGRPQSTAAARALTWRGRRQIGKNIATGNRTEPA